MPPVTETSWHLDKKVPIGMIIGILGQTVALAWFLASLNSQVDQLGRDAMDQAARIRVVEQTAQAQAVAGATTASQIAAITDTLSQIRQDQRSQIDMLRRLLEEKP